MGVSRRSRSKMAVAAAAAALHSALCAQPRILLPSRTVGRLWAEAFESYTDAPFTFL